MNSIHWIVSGVLPLVVILLARVKRSRFKGKAKRAPTCVPVVSVGEGVEVVFSWEDELDILGIAIEGPCRFGSIEAGGDTDFRVSVKLRFVKLEGMFPVGKIDMSRIHIRTKTVPEAERVVVRVSIPAIGMRSLGITERAGTIVVEGVMNTEDEPGCSVHVAGVVDSTVAITE